jgi:hypothetical protein
LHKGSKETVLVFNSNSDAGVPDLKLNHPLFRTIGNVQTDLPAGRRELDRIAQQIDQDLLEPAFIGFDARTGRIDLCDDVLAIRRERRFLDSAELTCSPSACAPSWPLPLPLAADNFPPQ